MYSTLFQGNVHKNQEWTQQQLLALEDDNVHLQEREREVQQVVKSIMDLNSIFRELAGMVKEQADMVDRRVHKSQTFPMTKPLIETLFP